MSSRVIIRTKDPDKLAEAINQTVEDAIRKCMTDMLASGVDVDPDAFDAMADWSRAECAKVRDRVVNALRRGTLQDFEIEQPKETDPWKQF